MGTECQTISQLNFNRCSMCGNEFDYEIQKLLPFYTIVENNQIKRVCPKCFPKYKHLWMI